MEKLNHYCDQCGEILDTELHYPVFSYMGGEELIFCDKECRDEFIEDNTREIFIDLKGRWIED